MNLCAELEDLGRVWIRGAFSNNALNELLVLCDVGDRPGARLDLSAALARHVGVGGVLAATVKEFGVDPAPVRLVAFNKSSSANWSVPWHQDRVIAVAEKKEDQRHSNWVSKGGFWHCEPPTELLEKMIFVRIHLDASNRSNGALELALGSHRHGLIEAMHARDVAETSEVEVCDAQPGDVLIAKALIVHRSKSAESKNERRALRVDFAPRGLLSPKLKWALPRE